MIPPSNFITYHHSDKYIPPAHMQLSQKEREPIYESVTYIQINFFLQKGNRSLPAAILLSGFTQSVRPLLYGVNVGGLGTLIASLASVISYRAYGNSENAQKGAYMKVFTIYNVVFLVILYGVAYFLQ